MRSNERIKKDFGKLEESIKGLNGDTLALSGQLKLLLEVVLDIRSQNKQKEKEELVQSQVLKDPEKDIIHES